MADETVWRSCNAPEDLPAVEDIIESCARAGSNRNGVCTHVSGKPRFWAKYGLSVTRGEGLTQAHVAGIVNNDPVPCVHVPDVYLIFSFGSRVYILVDFAEGMTIKERKKKTGRYGKVEMEAVTAVLRLTQIKMPADTAPGHIGGGCIGHNFFVDWLSTLKYPTVGALEKHINKVCSPFTSSTLHYRFALMANKILSLEGFGSRVHFDDEIIDGLVLCLSDLDASNFVLDDTGAIWAIDFGCTCFLPSLFVDYSLGSSSKAFGRRVATFLKYPKSDNFSAMSNAAGRLVIFGDSTFGKSRLSFLPRFAPLIIDCVGGPSTVV